MSLLLTEKDVLALCGRTYLERGRSYQRQGRVLELRWEKDEEVLCGRVSGSGRNVYEQSIQLYPRRRRHPFEGECSCPVGYNCKHVAAVLLEWIGRQRAPQPAAPPPKRRESELALWQKLFRQVLAAAPSSQPASGHTLIYLLKPQTYRESTKIYLHVYKSRPLKRGGWGKTSPFSLQQFASYYYYRPDWVTSQDLEIIELARHGLTGTSTPAIAGDVGVLLLRRLLASGRCFLESEEQPPLVPGPPRRAEFAWQEEPGGAKRLRISLQGVDGPWTALPTEPPWYIDPKDHQCGPIDQPLPSPLFQALLHLPAVPPAELESFSRFLFPLLPPESLPLPAKLEFEVCSGPPSPVLLLRGEAGPQGNTVHLARVQFAHGPLRLPPWNGVGEEQQLHRDAGREWLIRRNPACEEDCLRRLAAFGFVPAARAGAGEAGEWDLLFTGETVVQSASRWREFLVQLPQLEGEGWTIEIAESFRLRFETAGAVTARVDEAEGGWFDIGLDVDCQGRRLPLLPLLTEWLEGGGDPARGLLLPLGDGAWLEVPAAVLQPILDTLLELYRRPALNEAGQLRLPRQQAPFLDELERRLGGEGRLLSWQGGERLRLLARKLRDFAGIAPAEPPEGLRAELRPYQRQGLSWLQFLREYGFGGILADDMGLGKTVQALAHLLSEKRAGRLEKPALVVAPTSVLGNWRREAARFAPELRVLVLHGPERAEHFGQMERYDLIVTSYALLPRDAEALLEQVFHSVILDEAQAIKNARSKSAQTACLLRAENRLCLTGTPLENHLGELWSLFHFLMPGFLGHESDFNLLFRHPIEKRGDASRRQELTRRIAPFVLRREKGQVAAELPPKTEIVQSVELAEPQRRLYETIRAAMAEKVGDLLRQKGLARSHIEVLDALLKLRQACCDPRLVKLESARKVRHSAKLELLMEMLEELLEEGRKILLFSQFTSMLALVEEELSARRLKYVKLTGQTRKRDEVIAAFQGGEAPLFLISLKAGGVGLNLTAADTVIHYDPWWNPAVESQATDRAHRIGQDKPVFVYKLVAADTVEEKILQLQQRKQALADDIYRKAKEGEELTAFSAADILSLFAP